MMKLLAIDTSTLNLSLAVSSDEKILRYRNYPLGRVLSSAIIPSIKTILKMSDIPLDSLDGFAIGLGPGSFTGLRVGLATVKALAFAMKKPMVGVSSLDVLALSVREDNISVCSICDAKRNLLFACVYEKQGMALKKITQYLLTDIDNLLAKIKKPVVFVGDGISLYKDKLEKSQKVLRLEKKRYARPQAKYIIPLIRERFRTKNFESINKIIPLYLHPEDCQVRKKKK